MNQDNYPRSDWYARPAPPPPRQAPAPQQPPQAQYPPQAPAQPRRRRTGARLAGIIACVLVVLVGSVYAFSDTFGLHWDAGRPNKHIFTIEIPGSGDKDADGDADELPEDYSDDYRDFFSHAFTDYKDEHAPSKLKRTETGAAFRLRLESAEGIKICPQRLLQQKH